MRSLRTERAVRGTRPPRNGLAPLEMLSGFDFVLVYPDTRTHCTRIAVAAMHGDGSDLLSSSKKPPMSLMPLVSKSSASPNDRSLPASVVAQEPAIESRAASADESMPENSAPPRLPDRVREARTHAKLSKAELARRVGVCLSAAVQWEHPNGTSPTVANLARIADIADVAFEWLATGRGPMALVVTEDASTPPFANAANAFEERLLRAVREIPAHQYDLVLQFARSLAKNA